MSKKYDVIVIGGGPGGYVAAIRSAQLGFKTACVEMWKDEEGKDRLGGTCLNVGCIPSKALLESSALFHKAEHEFATHGIQASNVSIDVEAMITRKNTIVEQLTGGISQLFQANGIDWLKGKGKLRANKRVEVESHDGKTESYQAEKGVILAFGSLPIDIPVAKMDGEHIVSSTGALDFNSVPKRLGVIGAGVIGLELGSVWQSLGAEVTIFEAMDDFLSMADRQLAKEAERTFKKQGLNILLGTKVKSATVNNNIVRVTYETKEGEQTAEFDKLLVAVGRKPNTSAELVEGTKVAINERGFIEVDEHCRTAEPNVFAIGDCVRGPMLAHKAEEEGIMAAEILAGQAGHVRYDIIPSVIYTHPEMAWIGKTEEQLKVEGVDYIKGDFPFAANGRAKAMNAASGFVKILCDAETDEILGAHIIGPCASEMIHELIVAMEFYAAGEDLARIMHAHPTLSEAVHEAALAVSGQAIHKVNPKRK
ncbi:dihydrolipoyl dehydrogenase [Suttonella ornithocola]|uniref:Dihydrolipoyl dehydrogenase n=1 Tax=Suttonella ornithocola TaxID=279832 RepID=A0A380MUD3_9GAMM|nr:dihydrolipoyl dehydrogenase [Suttonella ornithocola]SUO95533.1 Dihydrolipoyl dehydrogenase [Suttonella ornithocola]